MVETKQITVKLLVTPQVSVVVTLPDGTPVEGATVELGSVIWEFLPLNFVTKYRSDSAGTVSISGLIPGAYFVQAYKEDDHVQATPQQVKIGMDGKADKTRLTMSLRAAPWYYTLKVGYPSVVGVSAASIMGELVKIEAQHLGSTIEEVRVDGSTVEIDYKIVEESPLVVTGGIIFGIFAGLTFLLVGIVVSWLLWERLKPPKEKSKFCDPQDPDKCFPDQESLAQHLIAQGDSKPYMCAYEGCNLRFPTHEEKVKHMDTFHEKRFPVMGVVKIVSFAAAAAYVLGKVFAPKGG